jgi:N-acetylglutamate synthase-like GNAT family acetyltransferase
MIIRDMTPEDLDVCREIVRGHWGMSIAEQAYLEMSEMFTSASRWPPHYIVAQDEFGIAGFAGFKSAWLMSNTFELIWINIHPSAMGKGLGIRLTEKRLEMIKQRNGTLVILMTQKPEFFTQFGFNSTQTFDTWTLMSKQLAPVTIDYDRSL